MADFIPGLKLSEYFYHEAVRPVLDADFPVLAHTAALIGSGSEVLGFDTPMSSDHHWGPRLILFLSQDDDARFHERIHETLRNKLPTTVHGYSTHFTPPDPEDNGTRLLQPLEAGPVNHMVFIYTLTEFFQSALNIDPYSAFDAADWLTFPSQRLRALTQGAVYHDDLGLNTLRKELAYYPHDVWLYLLAAGWTRIGQEEPFVGRTGYVGDDLGSQVIAARLTRDIMRLCFLMERQYAPYSKWFGTAFLRLACAERLTPLLRAAMLGQNWQEREKYLSAAYEILAEMHNALGITGALPTRVSPFHGRPFQVIHGESFASAIKAAIRDQTVKHIPTDIGAVDQFSDSTDLLENIGLRQRLKALYD
jgi:uncharacterized protein DUF4037